MTAPGARLRAAAILAPVVALILLHVGPLVTGSRTLILRDVLNTHAAMRVSLADGLRSGEIPLVDPLRSGGQALAGNANALAFYPDNLLLLVGSELWQLNMHFVLHWLLACVAMFWLCRAWGLGREGSIAGATIFVLSGYWLSQMNFYNAVAPVALAPALWAALLEAGGSSNRRRGFVLAALVWALMVLGGDPIVALIGLGSGLIVAVARHGHRFPWGRVAVSLALGAVIALPQIVETLRILPTSFRAVQGYAGSGAGVRDPRAVLDLVIPLFFGRPDLGAIWGKGLFGGHPPIYFSLAPGLLAIALAFGAGPVRRREARWLTVLVVAATAVTYSGGTPLPGWLSELPGGQLLRFPEKAFLVAALGLALAAGRGFERLARGEARRALRLGLAALLLVCGSSWLFFGISARGSEQVFATLFSEIDTVTAWQQSRLRWAGIAMFATGLVALGCITLILLRRRPWAAATVLLVLHAASQMAFLSSLLATDDASQYARPPAVTALVDRSEVVAQGSVTDLFGEDDMSALADRFPDRHVRWLHRTVWSELHAFSALSSRHRLELAFSAEGLDTFVLAAVAQGMKQFDDRARIAVLRATGVDVLVLPRPLALSAVDATALRAAVPGLARTVYLYEIPAPLPEVTLAGSIVRAPHMNAALEAIWRPGFDPATTAVVAGSGAPVVAPSGSARLVVSERERAEVEIDSPAGGVLILRRAHLPIWKATIDGEPAPTVIAQLTRLAVEVPPGPHRVVFSISRWPLRISSAAALLALVALVVLWRRDGRRGDGPGAGEVAA